MKIGLRCIGRQCEYTINFNSDVLHGIKSINGTDKTESIEQMKRREKLNLRKTKKLQKQTGKGIKKCNG